MSEARPRVLLIEDDSNILRFLHTVLATQKFEVHDAGTGREGLELARQHKPDLVILDLGLPDMDGVEVVRALREWNRTPILVLSARNLEESKIATLDTGADDYLTKPFGVGELLARVRVALRHADAKPGDRGEFAVGDLRVDLAHRRVTVAGREIRLTPTEYQLLHVLIHNAGRVTTQRQLLREVWGPDHSEDSHYLRIYMAQLRRKLEKDPAQPRYLVTETGVGYRLVDT